MTRTPPFDFRLSERVLKALPRSSDQSGVTLMEMMVVMTIIGIMAGAVYPSVASSLDGIRLTSASNDVVSFLNGAGERANRRQVAVEVAIDPGVGTLLVHSTEAGFERRYDLPESVRIVAIEPDLPTGLTNGNQLTVRRFVIYPGGNVPRIGIVLANRNGAQRLIRIDPITGAPRIERSTAGVQP